jgi:hypothetical protein
MAKTKPVPSNGLRALRPGERRFVAKPQTDGRKTVWGVYDRQRGCWPFNGPEWGGAVNQSDQTEATAQAEADRLEALRG